MSPEAFVARTSPARVALMILGALVFVALGAWLIGWLGEPPASRRFSPQMIYAIGWATIIFFGLAALFGLRMFGKRRDVLIIDEHGLTWRNWSDEHIPWDAVAKIEERDQIGQKMFCVHLHHPERHPSTTMLGRVAGLNGAMGFAAITITATGTDRSTDELRDALALHAP